MTGDATDRTRIWTPNARIIDPRDFDHRQRRRHRHGRERSRSEPMPARRSDARRLDDSLAVKVTNVELRNEWGHPKLGDPLLVVFALCA